MLVLFYTDVTYYTYGVIIKLDRAEGLLPDPPHRWTWDGQISGDGQAASSRVPASSVKDNNNTYNIMFTDVTGGMGGGEKTMFKKCLRTVFFPINQYYHDRISDIASRIRKDARCTYIIGLNNWYSVPS